jgi:IS66 Orf2 like protein
MLEHTIKRVFVVRFAVDFRKGPSSLTALMYKLNLNPYKGDCAICLNRRGAAVKILCGDALGVWLLERRYEGGRLQSPWAFLAELTTTEITVAQLSMILEGCSFMITRTARPFRQ